MASFSYTQHISLCSSSSIALTQPTGGEYIQFYNTSFNSFAFGLARSGLAFTLKQFQFSKTPVNDCFQKSLDLRQDLTFACEDTDYSGP